MKEWITFILILAFAFTIIKFNFTDLTEQDVEFFRILNFSMMIILAAYFSEKAVDYVSQAMAGKRKVRQTETGDYDERV